MGVGLDGGGEVSMNGFAGRGLGRWSRFPICAIWILLLVAALVLYFKHKEVTNWFVKLATLVVLIALSLVFIMQIITNPWTLSVFALVICLLSYFSYRKKKSIIEKTFIL